MASYTKEEKIKYIIFAIFLLVARADVELGKRVENATPENAKARQRAPK